MVDLSKMTKKEVGKLFDHSIFQSTRKSMKSERAAKRPSNTIVRLFTPARHSTRPSR